MKVRIYTTPTCVYCQMTKEFFRANNVEFEELDVASNEEAAKEMIEKTGQMGVPVIIINKDDNSEEIIIGFQKERLAEILGINLQS